MRRTNGIAAGLAALLMIGTAANAGQTKGAKLTLRVVTDKKIYLVNAPIKMTFTVKNAEKKPVALTFNSGKRYDFVVSSQSGHEMWQWSKGRMFTMDIGTETLGAGKTLTYTETYKPGTPAMPALKPGTYILSAYPAAMDTTLPKTTTAFKVAAGK